MNSGLKVFPHKSQLSNDNNENIRRQIEGRIDFIINFTGDKDIFNLDIQEMISLYAQADYSYFIQFWGCIKKIPKDTFFKLLEEFGLSGKDKQDFLHGRHDVEYFGGYDNFFNIYFNPFSTRSVKGGKNGSKF